MELIEYNNTYFNDWDTFIDHSKNGTIFHKRCFLNYHERGKFEDSSLLLKHKNKIVSVFPAAIVEGGDGSSILKSHPGSSYGGPVFNEKLGGLHIVIDTIDMIIDYALNKGISSIEMRISPRVFHRCPSEELEYVLWYKGFDIINTELSSAVQLMFKTKKQIVNKCRYNTRQPAKKAFEAGVVVKESNDYEEFWHVLELNLARHSATPTHSFEEINLLKALLPKGSLRLFGSYLNGVLIAGVVIFVCNEVACHTFYIAQDYEYQRVRPLNLLLIEVIKWAHNEGFRFLNFGISTESGGTIINPSLFRFKEGFGATGTVRRHYRKNLLLDEI